MRKRAAMVGLLLIGVAGARGAGARQADPLGRLDVEPPGWNGIRLGMSLVQLERRLGTTLPVSPGAGQPVCSRFATRGDYDGYRLVMGFSAAKPGAKLESLWVQFGGAEAGASAPGLAAALRRRVPQAAYQLDPKDPAESEAADVRPIYTLPGRTVQTGEPAAVIRFFPRDGALIALRSCLLP
jgi:hypothetical protein